MCRFTMCESRQYGKGGGGGGSDGRSGGERKKRVRLQQRNLSEKS